MAIDSGQCWTLLQCIGCGCCLCDGGVVSVPPDWHTDIGASGDAGSHDDREIYYLVLAGDANDDVFCSFMQQFTCNMSSMPSETHTHTYVYVYICVCLMCEILRHLCRFICTFPTTAVCL